MCVMMIHIHLTTFSPAFYCWLDLLTFNFWWYKIPNQILPRELPPYPWIGSRLMCPPHLKPFCLCNFHLKFCFPFLFNVICWITGGQAGLCRRLDAIRILLPPTAGPRYCPFDLAHQAFSLWDNRLFKIGTPDLSLDRVNAWWARSNGQYRGPAVGGSNIPGTVRIYTLRFNLAHQAFSL